MFQVGDKVKFSEKFLHNYIKEINENVEFIRQAIFFVSHTSNTCNAITVKPLNTPAKTFCKNMGYG